MTHSTADFIRGCFGCALLFVLVAGVLNVPDAVQNAVGVFGFVYGGLWLKHS